ncbi:MAG: nuclear transport factor 2 family protein [Deltaproteobacteria bacterium]|nr:nuclear transport factor 2 family protein [Deltaproteobacteria bacterium]
MSAENEKLVTDFCQSWTRKNVDEVLSYLTDDCFYHNIPMEPCEGKAAIRKFIEPFLKDADTVSFEIKHTTSAGNAVMNERVDRFVMGPKKIELPVAGVFEIRDGKIAAWRDYFDLATFTKQMG